MMSVPSSDSGASVPAVSSTDVTPAAAEHSLPLPPSCKFGAQCRLRAKETHCVQFSHPLTQCPDGCACALREKGWHVATFSHRPPCRFGSKCHSRGSSDHLKNFSHPPLECRDGHNCENQCAFHRADFLHRVSCQFGSRCNLRGNRQHLLRYSHPPAQCRNDPDCENWSIFHRADFLHEDSGGPGGSKRKSGAELSPASSATSASSPCGSASHRNASSAGVGGLPTEGAGNEGQSASVVAPRKVDSPSAAATERAASPHHKGSIVLRAKTPRYWGKVPERDSRLPRGWTSAIAKLVKQCCSDRMGAARDQRMPGSYATLVVDEVSLVRDERLWFRFRNCPRHRTEPVDHAERVKVASWAPWMSHYDLDAIHNEVFLFHGTKHENVQEIKRRGFDDHFASAGGLFGAGIYFSDSASKADQYTTPDADGFFYMFLARARLGRIFNAGAVTTSPKATHWRKPPEGFDSVEGKVNYREFVIYDDEQTYPELLIKYRRG